MKKLLVIALSVVMVFVFAAVSMAAEVTLNGVVKAGYDWAGDGGDNVSYTELTANVKLNDSVSAKVVYNWDPIRSGDVSGTAGIDEGDFTITQSYGTFQFGYFGFNVKDDVDIINGIFGGNDVKNSAQVKATFKLTDHVSAMGFFSPVQDGIGFYAANLAYAADRFGVDTYYTAAENKDFKGTGDYDATEGVYSNKNFIYKSAYAANAYVKPTDSTKVFVHYGKATIIDEFASDVDPESLIVGATFESEDIPVFARFEYDTKKGLTDEAARNPWGFRLGYKFTNGVIAQYDRQVGTSETYYTYNGGTATYGDTSKLRLIVNF